MGLGFTGPSCTGITYATDQGIDGSILIPVNRGGASNERGGGAMAVIHDGDGDGARVSESRRKLGEKEIGAGEVLTR